MIEPATQGEVIHRLKGVEGHIRGVLHMVDEGRPCTEILQQMQAIQGSLRQISLLILAQHLDVCLAEVRSDSKSDVYQQMRNELLALYIQKV